VPHGPEVVYPSGPGVTVVVWPSIVMVQVLLELDEELE